MAIRKRKSTATENVYNVEKLVGKRVIEVSSMVKPPALFHVSILLLRIFLFFLN